MRDKLRQINCSPMPPRFGGDVKIFQMKAKTIKILKRISVLPFVFCIHVISYMWCSIAHTYRFILHGGEWINYYKTNPSVKDVYEEVRNQLIFTKITADAIKDFNKIRTEPALTKNELLKGMENFGNQFQDTVCEIFDKAENIKHFGTK